MKIKDFHTIEFEPAGGGHGYKFEKTFEKEIAVSRESRDILMLKILNEKKLKTTDEIENQYKNCKYLCIIDSYDKIADNNGYLYCVSTSEDSFGQLIDESDHLLEEGRCCIIGGSYNNGGAVGVQYEFEG